MKSRSGFTVPELLLVIFMGMLLISSSFFSISSFLSRAEISGAVSTVRSSLSQARYISVSESRKVKFKITNNTIHLQLKKENKWVNNQILSINGKVFVSSNSSPVFSPTGTASPLCSIRVRNKMYSYLITLSFAGRIKIRKL